MNLAQKKHLYSGKAKTLYATDDPNLLIAEFRDDATAFNGEKHKRFKGKGEFNNKFNAFIMQHLQQQGVPTHFVKVLKPNTAAVKKLDMIPVECVVRNRAAGGLCKRLGIQEGQEFKTPLFEFFYKSDKLNDPMINIAHIRAFEWATDDEIEQMQAITFKVNEVLKPLFAEAGLDLIDYKLEFGRFEGQLLLGDEFTPDGCRVWNAKTKEKLDKDRFRHDLGDLMMGYQDIADRLGI